MSNKRNEGERVSVDLLVDYASDGNYLFDFCRDLGAGGIFIATETPKPNGEKISLTFTIPDSKETLNLQGIVMWSQKSGAGNGSAGMGVQFTDYNPDDRKLLEDFVSRYTKD